MSVHCAETLYSIAHSLHSWLIWYEAALSDCMKNSMDVEHLSKARFAEIIVVGHLHHKTFSKVIKKKLQLSKMPCQFCVNKHFIVLYIITMHSAHSSTHSPAWLLSFTSSQCTVHTHPHTALPDCCPLHHHSAQCTLIHTQPCLTVVLYMITMHSAHSPTHSPAWLLS